MKKFDDDKELRSLIKSMSPDSPGSDFSGKVMNRIFEMESLLEKIKRERIFGKGFWIITSLFVVLMGTLIVFSVTGSSGSESQLLNLLPDVNASGVAQGYENTFEKITSLPLSIAGILLASSFLIFIDRLLSAKKKINA